MVEIFLPKHMGQKTYIPNRTLRKQYFFPARYAIINVLEPFYGRVAQLGERLGRNEEVVGSIPITSKFFKARTTGFFIYPEKDKI